MGVGIVAFTLPDEMSVEMISRVGVGLRTTCIRLFPFFLVVLLTACQPPEVAPRRTTVIRIAGATAMQPVLYDLTTAFNREHPTIFFEVAGGGSTTGEERVMAQQIDLAASNLLSPTVSTTNQGSLTRGAIRTPIGIDGLAIIVHPSNTLTKLTLPQLQALYNGRILTWDEVGGSPGEVLLISREEGSGSRQLFDVRVMGEERVSLTAVVMPTSKDVVDYVATHPAAIGYVSRAYVVGAIEQAAQPTTPAPGTQAQPTNTPAVKVLALADQWPTQQALQTQSYPLLQVLYFMTNARPTGALQQFIDFTLSPAGQALVARYHGRVR